MTTTSCRARRRSLTGTVLFGVLCLAAAPTPVCAQRAGAQPSNVAPADPAAAPAIAVQPQRASDQDAGRTRQELHDLLSEHPPTVREVLQRDPGLLTNAAYLAAYPRVAGFLAAHPEVERAPGYFLGQPERVDERDGASWMWRDMMTSISVGVLLLMGGLGFGWLVRTALDHRRWQRVSKVQVDTHGKLLDRLTTSEDLRAYMASPAGRQFLESAPIALDGKATPMAAPVSRILWSLQVGVVALFGGVALQFVSRGVVEDAAQPLRVLGVLLAAIGAGFLFSAGLSYVLSRHLGLLGPGTSGDRPASQSVPQV